MFERPGIEFEEKAALRHAVAFVHIHVHDLPADLRGDLHHVGLQIGIGGERRRSIGDDVVGSDRDDHRENGDHPEAHGVHGAANQSGDRSADAPGEVEKRLQGVVHGIVSENSGGSASLSINQASRERKRPECSLAPDPAAERGLRAITDKNLRSIRLMIESVTASLRSLTLQLAWSDRR